MAQPTNDFCAYNDMYSADCSGATTYKSMITSDMTCARLS